ncbi:MAG: T9SS type A sorting domain-containing protein [Crocinitomicaceae bacterium]|nr:T9SS type A sorting domain-containing protein [Crocinitomicaceae bacterium]
MKHFYFLLALFAVAFNSYAQHKCMSQVMWNSRMLNNPNLAERRAESERKIAEWIAAHKDLNDRSGTDEPFLTIPCVFHVLWNDGDQNISDDQIYSQLDVLNEDFRQLNIDAPDVDHPFYYESSDTFIEFCLAQQDPDGYETDGIVRTYTDVEYWDEENLSDMKSYENGGADNWDPTRYLNFWIYQASPEGGTLGFATFPDELEENPFMDGVAISNKAFGLFGTVEEPNIYGRTSTHEVGHWLFLRHIWGDETCGNDLVDDTPVHFEENFGCPEYPHNPYSDCGTDERGEMFMNFMDYTDDGCMSMFTYGQAERMLASIDEFRFELLTSEGCEAGNTTGIGNTEKNIFSAYPNPASDIVRVSFVSSGAYSVRLQDSSGRIVLNEKINARIMDVDADKFGSGIYFLTVRNEKSGVVQQQKICIQ